MLSRALIGLSVAALGFVVGAPPEAEASTACVQGAVLYELKFDTGANGDAFLVSGTRSPGGSLALPITGSFTTLGDGSLVISLSEEFDWGTGLWVHPHGTTILRFSSGSFTYDTTYYGDVNMPTNNVTGTASVVACPSGSAADASTDPNAGD